MKHLEYADRELGKTIICNLHFLSLSRGSATRVIALKKGEMVFDGGSALDMMKPGSEKSTEKKLEKLKSAEVSRSGRTLPKLSSFAKEALACVGHGY